MEMSKNISEMSDTEFDVFFEEFFRIYRDELANMLFEPVPELTKAEKEEIQRQLDTSPTWREKEKHLFIEACGEDYARKKGLLDDDEETVSQNPG